ncbi:MAG: tRNA (guanosine(37)-N1)-methyltransferase TrmD [Bacilli bacterium]|nr:tRNA (guanosine(37)-N1)-methyltransferase TrmD [Bacilli bacterium]
MKIDILTLFPEMFEGFLTESIIKRAIEKDIVEVNIINFRDYTTDSHGKVDSTPFGGGAGMVLQIEPIYNALMDIKKDDSHVILLTPSGKTFNQKKARELSKKKHIILICGHYEGFDYRIKNLVDEEVSIGDFVLTGGELPSMMISDAIIRLLPNAISSDSLESESFDDGLLDYPVYTKPRDFKGMKVPDVLLSGNHAKIEEYRELERKRITEEKLKSEND